MKLAEFVVLSYSRGLFLCLRLQEIFGDDNKKGGAVEGQQKSSDFWKEKKRLLVSTI